MPWRKINSPYWKVRRKNLPGFGDSGTLSTRTTSLKRAREMDDLLVWLADEEVFDVLEALRPQARGETGRVTLPDVLRAKKENRLPDFRRSLVDPPLADALKAFLPRVTYNNHRLGVRHIYRLALEPGPGKKPLAPPSARLSWLTVPRNVNDVMATMLAEGYAPNTVQTSVWGALSKLLQHQLGKARAAAALAECQRPGADDARDVWLSAEDCHRVVSACEWEVRMALILMSSTGIDVGPLLRLRVRDFDAARWAVYVPDTKTASRKRTVELAPVGAYLCVLLSADVGGERRGAGDPLVSLTRGQLNHRWRLAREAAHLTEATGFREDVRMKDLRHTFAKHYLSGGGNIAALASRMGHTREAQSLAYAKHEISGLDDMERAATSLGMTLPAHLRAELEAVAPRPGQAEQRAVEMPAWWFDRSAPPRVGEAELALAKRYEARGTAGYAEDPAAYTRRHRQARAVGA